MTDPSPAPRPGLALALLVATAAACASNPPVQRALPPRDGWRAVHLIGYESDGDLEVLGRNIPALAARGINVLILEVDYNFAFVSHPELRRGAAPITPEGAHRLLDICRRHSIPLIPEFQSLGHQSWEAETFPLLTVYPHFDLTPGAFPGNKGIYCREWDPLNPEVNRIVLELMDEIVEAFDGSSYVNGYPGGDPNTVGVAPWMDAGQAMHGAFAILCALHHCEQTGEGQSIDAAMIEGSANFLAELIMDNVMNGRVGERMGNRDSVMAPHGCYRCQGEYAWVAIAVANDVEWHAFCKAIGDPEWTRRPEFGDQLSRWQNQDELDKHVEEWTRKHGSYEAMEMLQKAGVMAGASLGPKELVEDPHLKARGFFPENDHSVIGKLIYAGRPFRLSNAARGKYGPAPLLGEHNKYVLGGLLGMSDSEIAGLVTEKVLL